ncbi:head GIN domain-containing protein [Marixanthomonas ophiurae]|uniref:DUF2807 domain-containing protein n=1 Tax=Marixanthomonas ophiurae TaxID=387659 RepID=A0A3E1QEB8_9FLAO|nr:head GIN domain-containing protein [Marixanthomonas ophiurae]RFN60493.1 DUF2807 domain-containing protein [Marixanthomonas ophiurae]
MKKSIFLIMLLAFLGCDSDKGLNCFQAAGDIVQEEFAVGTFSKITVWERTQLFIKQGDIQKVVVETGENLLNDIEVQVEDGMLNLRNNNGCNLVRDYGLTKVYVTTPNIDRIRNSSGLSVESIGTLSFPNLTLISEDQENEDEYHIDGDFKLNLQVENLQIVANGLSNFFLTGTANTANFGIYAGDVRIQAANLLVGQLTIFHRGTQDMIVNPQEAIRGKIVSLGDIIAKNRPPIVEVEALYRGRLIFEEQ